MGLFQAARTPGVPAETDAAMPPAPGIGEHGREILAGHGLGADRIAGLLAEGVLYLPATA
jgi:crotonobetainyl-CoA:carnitine CoA-transferase CaiB-like acyl-CoA transferase